jgi:Mrp family chromosome partitioning ATPase
MLPGVSDVTLDVIQLVRRISFLVVTTPSPLANATAGKQIDLLSELWMTMLGLSDNEGIVRRMLSDSQREASSQQVKQGAFSPKREKDC